MNQKSPPNSMSVNIALFVCVASSLLSMFMLWSHTEVFGHREVVKMLTTNSKRLTAQEKAFMKHAELMNHPEAIHAIIREVEHDVKEDLRDLRGRIERLEIGNDN